MSKFVAFVAIKSIVAYVPVSASFATAYDYEPLSGDGAHLTFC